MNATIVALFEQLVPEQAKEVNSICDRFERLWRTGEAPQLESILQTVELTIRLVTLHELVLVDVMYRHPRPTRETLDGYRQRFSDLDIPWLSKQLGIQDGNAFDSTLPHHDPWSDLSAERNQPAPDRIGKFELVRQIGQGGMGIVYQALQTDLNRTVALKTLTKLVARNAEARNRFRAEVETVARLHHPHIVQIFEIGMEGGTPYYSMEFVEGGSLAEIVREHPLAARTAAKLMGCIARAIDYAHSCDIVHRDLKPANILLARSKQQDGVRLEQIGSSRIESERPVEYFEPKIADFGLAKRLDSDSQDTLQGAALGTPSYMSPEQATGKSPIGPSSDIYSLGAVLYDLLIGRPPFHSATPAETIQQVLQDEPVPIRKMRPDVPVDLETICLKCLSKEPARRYASARELAEDLSRFLDGRTIHARRATWMERLGKSIRRHPAMAALWLTLVMGIAGTTWQWRSAEAQRVIANDYAQSAEAAHRRENAERARVERTLYAHDIALANFEYQSSHILQARELLTQAPEALRNWEWDFINRRMAQGHQDLPKFDMTAWAVAISPDGKLIASGSGIWGKPDQGEIRVWERETGRLLWFQREHPGPVMDLHFDPSGKLLLSCGARFTRGKLDGGVILWDAASGQVRWRENNLDAQVSTFSFDGSHCLTGTTSGIIDVRETSTGKSVRKWKAHNEYISDLGVWEQGKYMISTSRDGFMRIWNFETGALVHEDLLNSPDRVSCSIDGKSFAVGMHHGEMRCYEFHEENVTLKFKTHLGERIGGMSYSQDGQYLIASALNKPIRLVDPNNGRILHELYGHDGNTTDIAQSSNGCFIASCGFNGTVTAWDLAEPQNYTKHEVGGPVIADVEFLTDSNLVAMAMTLNPGNRARELGVKIWDVSQSKFVRHLMGHSDWLTSIAVDHRNQLLVSGSLDKSARLWSLTDWSSVRSLEGHDSAVIDVAFAGVDHVVTAEANGAVRVWNYQSGDQIEKWSIPGDECKQIAAITTAELVAAAGKSGSIWLYCLGASEPIRGIHTNVAEVAGLAFSPNGELLAVSRVDSTIEVFEAKQLANSQTQPTPIKIIGATGAVHDVCFSPDGRRLVSCGSDRVLKLWDTETGLEFFSIPNVGLNGSYNQVAFSPNGETILLSDHNTSQSWSIAPRPADYMKWHSQEAAKAVRNQSWPAVAHHLAHLSEMRSLDDRELTQLGNARAELGRLDDAIDAYQAAAKLREKRNPTNDYLLSLLFRQQGRQTELDTLQTSMLAEFGASSNANTLNILAWTFALSPSTNDFVPLVTIAEKAAASKRQDAINTLGAIYMRAGRDEQAIETIRNSIAKSSDQKGDIYDWLLLSIAYSNMQDFENGRVWLDKTERYLEPLQKRPNPTGPAGTWSNRIEITGLLEEARQKCHPSMSND